MLIPGLFIRLGRGALRPLRLPQRPPQRGGCADSTSHHQKCRTRQNQQPDNGCNNRAATQPDEGQPAGDEVGDDNQEKDHQDVKITTLACKMRTAVPLSPHRSNLAQRGFSRRETNALQQCGCINGLHFARHGGGSTTVEHGDKKPHVSEWTFSSTFSSTFSTRFSLRHHQSTAVGESSHPTVPHLPSNQRESSPFSCSLRTPSASR